MKVIGLISDMRWNFPLAYYWLSNESVAEEAAGFPSARVILYNSLGFDETGLNGRMRVLPEGEHK
jgi:aspartate/glutamate racemase